MVIVFFFFAVSIFSQKKVIEDFGNSNEWKIFSSDGVETSVYNVNGIKNNAVHFEYNFKKGSGYGGIQKMLSLTLPENYEFSFYLRASSPANNLEIKFLDESGENVWWMNNRNYEFPTEWTKFIVKKRHINFAWGPIQDKSFKKFSRIEFTIASYVGGSGWIELDELEFKELPKLGGNTESPQIFSSHEISNKFSAGNILDSNDNTKWLSDKVESKINIDLKFHQEIGGLKIIWDDKNFAKAFSLFVSDDNISWEKIYEVSENVSSKSFIRLKDIESRYIRLALTQKQSEFYGIKSIEILRPEATENLNRFFINVAKEFPRGFFPRYFNEEKSYWTIVGVNSDSREALINEDGMVEVDKQKFSLEPMLYIDKKLVTWNDVKREQSLEDKYLPIPNVKWIKDNLQLDITAFANGEANKKSVLFCKYKLTNKSNYIKEGKLNLLVRPFQVNPYYQWLNIEGGVSKILQIDIRKNEISVDDKKIYFLSPFQNAGAITFSEGNIPEILAEGNFPLKQNISDKNKLGSAVVSYDFYLRSGESKEIVLAVPFHNSKYILSDDEKKNLNAADELFALTKKEWIKKINYVKFDLPADAEKLVNTYRSNLGYILINRDNYGIQPGSRSYERSWIRDGSLTSAALLKSGITNEVKEFIEWYSDNLFENGKVPCVVDRRGPDPVPENDSHGEYLFLLKQYYDFTKDLDFLKKYNSKIINTVNYIKELIDQRTNNYFIIGNDSLKALYGIMPESISHEGYSAKPMHSYWDDFFTLRGLKDAAEIERLLNNTEEYYRIKNIKDKFENNLLKSISVAIKYKGIDYIPGCAELGDFDATSTSIALYPTNIQDKLPEKYLQNTFNKYFDYFSKRRDNKIDWVNYTPYEVRTIGSFILLNQPQRAFELIDFFLKDQRPKEWNHWAEVVWKDERFAGFIGDMPHTWVGSDFINSFRSIFVYELDSAMVIASALKKSWIDSSTGISVSNMPTKFGEISYSVKKENGKYLFNISGNVEIPSKGIWIKNFNDSQTPKKVLINGNLQSNFTSDKVLVNTVPALIEIFY